MLTEFFGGGGWTDDGTDMAESPLVKGELCYHVHLRMTSLFSTNERDFSFTVSKIQHERYFHFKK